MDRLPTRPRSIEPGPPATRAVAAARHQAALHAAGHRAVARSLGTDLPAGCPRIEYEPGDLPALAEFRRDLSVLVAGLVVDLLVLGRVTQAGGADHLVAVERCFDVLRRGTRWPATGVQDTPARLESCRVAEALIGRTMLETERAVVTAAKVLLRSRLARGEVHVT